MSGRRGTFYCPLPYWCTLELSEDAALPCWGLIQNTMRDVRASASSLKYLCSPRLLLLSPLIVLRTIGLFDSVCCERLPCYQLRIHIHRAPAEGLTPRNVQGTR